MSKNSTLSSFKFFSIALTFYIEKNTKKENRKRCFPVKVLNTIAYLLVIVLLLGLNSCKKDEPVPSPGVQILSPKANDIVLLPGGVKIHLKVKSEKKIKFVQVSFVNYDQAHLFEPQQYYSDSTFVEIDETIELGLLPQGFFSPYYLYVTVIGGAGTHTYFQPIDFINPDLKYKGFYVSTRPSIGTTQVLYYDNAYNESPFTTVNGEFQSSTSSDYQDYYYLSTTIPSNFYAYRHEDEELIWDETAELPIPIYTSIHYRSNTIYTATANGRIKSFNAINGSPDIITPAMPDTVPLHIEASEDHILAEFLSKNSGSNILVVYYRRTGTLARKRPLNFSVADIIVGKYGFNFIVFGNELNSSLCTTYQPIGNFLSDTRKIDQGLIKQVVRYDPDRFFLHIENGIYFFNYLNGSNKPVVEFNEDIIQFQFDNINSRLFIAFVDRVEIYSYPNADLIHTQPIPDPVKGLDLRISY